MNRKKKNLETVKHCRVYLGISLIRVSLVVHEQGHPDNNPNFNTPISQYLTTIHVEVGVEL